MRHTGGARTEHEGGLLPRCELRTAAATPPLQLPRHSQLLCDAILACGAVFASLRRSPAPRPLRWLNMPRLLCSANDALRPAVPVCRRAYGRHRQHARR
eukprot:COSAG01_NODE_30526_length_614_cov_1.042718_1_plen_98_part_01